MNQKELRSHRGSEPEEKGVFCNEPEATRSNQGLSQKKNGHSALKPKVLRLHQRWTQGIVLSEKEWFSCIISAFNKREVKA